LTFGGFIGNAIHSGRSSSQEFERILKQITHKGLSIMLKSQGRAIDQYALYLA